MCIIVLKPKKINLPSLEIMQNCFENNPHGAGFMYRLEGKIHISKGYMTIDDLTKAIALVQESVNLKKTDMVIHFRISTTGSTIPANTHPFPLSNHVEDLKALNLIVDRAIAHNGILADYSKFHNADSDMSDTMYFAKMLSGVNDRFIAPILDVHARGSKFVCMTGKKTISFGMIKEGGLYFSNYGFRKFVFVAPEPVKTFVASTIYDDEKEWERWEKSYVPTNKRMDYKPTSRYETPAGVIVRDCRPMSQSEVMRSRRDTRLNKSDLKGERLSAKITEQEIEEARAEAIYDSLISAGYSDQSAKTTIADPAKEAKMKEKESFERYLIGDVMIDERV